jgi:hypothetical protein
MGLHDGLNPRGETTHQLLNVVALGLEVDCRHDITGPEYGPASPRWGAESAGSSGGGPGIALTSLGERITRAGRGALCRGEGCQNRTLLPLPPPEKRPERGSGRVRQVRHRRLSAWAMPFGPTRRAIFWLGRTRPNGANSRSCAWRRPRSDREPVRPPVRRCGFGAGRSVGDNSGGRARIRTPRRMFRSRARRFAQCGTHPPGFPTVTGHLLPNGRAH